MHRGLALASFLLATTAAAQDNSYPSAYLSHVEGEVSLQRASESEPESGALNVPLLPGDRVWTRANSRAEIRVGSGLVLHLSEGAKLDIVESDGDTILRLWSGSAKLHLSEPPGELRLDTPAGSVRPTREGSYRVDIESGDAVSLAVERGSAELASSLGTVLVQSGETSFATPSEAPSIPVDFNTARVDEFDRWSDSRVARQSRTQDVVVRSLPPQVRSYADELVDYGDWDQEPDYGYVWYPRVDVGWSPYTYGRWGYTHWGHTWISSEPWGWAPYHYGRWGFGHRGWYWIPGATWGPAWVSFAIGPTWVGWSPLGYYNRPVFGFNAYFGGYGGGYYHHGGGNHYRGGWNVCSRNDFRSGVVTRAGYRRLEPESLRASVPSARFVDEVSSLDRDLAPRTARFRDGRSIAGDSRSRSEEAIRGFRERASSPSSRVIDETRTASPSAERPREASEISEMVRRGREIQSGSVGRETPERETRRAFERPRTIEGRETTPRSTSGTTVERTETPERQGFDRSDRARDRVLRVFTPPEPQEVAPTSPSVATPRTDSRGSRMRSSDVSSRSRSRGEPMEIPSIRTEAPSSDSSSRRQMSSGGESRSSRERSSSVGSSRSSRSSGGSDMSSGRSRGSQSSSSSSSRGSQSGQRGSARPRSNQR